jgi:hypothetical protein
MRCSAEDHRPTRAYGILGNTAISPPQANTNDVHHSKIRSWRGQPQPTQQGRDQRAACSSTARSFAVPAATCQLHPPQVPAASWCTSQQLWPAYTCPRSPLHLVNSVSGQSQLNNIVLERLQLHVPPRDAAGASAQ